jgi:hypothetical protein
VGVNLGKPGYLEEVAKQTADIDVAIVFCNAGYMLTGFFDSMCVISPITIVAGGNKTMPQTACNHASAAE